MQEQISTIPDGEQGGYVVQRFRTMQHWPHAYGIPLAEIGLGISFAVLLLVIVGLL